MVEIRNADIPVIVMAGGKGTRLRALDSTRPKPMVLANGKPFLHWLISHHIRQGFRRFIVSIGYLAEQFEAYPWKKEFPEADIKLHRETEPLGTGGATRDVFQKNREIDFAWVVNGDTLLPDFLPPIDVLLSDEVMYCTLGADAIFDATPNLAVHGDRIVGEAASGAKGERFDAGAVFVKRVAIERYAGKIPCSFHQLIEKSMLLGKVGFYPLGGTCYDIGTPERHARFERALKDGL